MHALLKSYLGEEVDSAGFSLCAVFAAVAAAVVPVAGVFAVSVEVTTSVTLAAAGGFA